MSFRFNGTYLMHLITNPGIPHLTTAGTVDAIDYDCAGLYGKSTCGTPNPKWRHNVRVTWSTPWSGLQISGAWRYVGDVQAYGVSTNPFLTSGTYPSDVKLGSQSYFDLSAEWKLKDHLSFRLGVENIADKQPPLVGSNMGGTDPRYNGNTYPGVYDALGRYGFFGITADF